MLLISAMLGLFVLASVCDYRAKSVPDWITALLWLGCLFFAPQYGVIVISFATLYALNTFSIYVQPKPVLGWADILILPPYFALFGAFGLGIFGIPLAILGACGPSLAAIIWKKGKEDVPAVPAYTLFLFIGLISGFGV